MKSAHLEQIAFRGKVENIYPSLWRYGSLIRRKAWKDDEECTEFYEYFIEEEYSTTNRVWKVIPETIGQLVTTSKYVKVYEGDVILIRPSLVSNVSAFRGIIERDDSQLRVRCLDGHEKHYHPALYNISILEFSDIQVLGNVHDDQEWMREDK